MKKKKTKSIKQLKRELWGWYSKYSRLKNAGQYGYVNCVTCGKRMKWNESVAGHFKHASKGNTVTYDERNVNSQCISCNSFKNGNLAEYAFYIERTYGKGTIMELEQVKSRANVMIRDEYEALITKHKSKVEELLGKIE